MPRYGQKGGDGPTAGRKAATYEVTLPDGTKVQKKKFGMDKDTAIASAWRLPAGGYSVVVWHDEVLNGAVGQFGQLKAKRIA